MRKLPKILFISFLAIFLIAGNVMAYPFIEVEGYVDPKSAIWTDKGDGTWFLDNLLYSFKVTEAYEPTGLEPARMNGLNLEFENDVFVDIDGIGGADISDVSFLDPSDWFYSEFPSSTSNYIRALSGTPVSEGDILQFTLDVNIYDIALTNSALWQEGAIWAQSWMASDTFGGGDGGSTAFATPEPATMLMIGSGLIGFAAFKRRKLFKKKR